MGNIAVAVDTNSGLTIERGRELGIYVLPMPFSVDGKEYLEGVDLKHQQFFEMMENDADVTTSQPAVNSLMEFWDDILKENDELIYIPMSSSLSSSLQTAAVFANEDEYRGRVHVIDNHRIAVTQTFSAIEAKYLVSQGKSSEEICEFLNATMHDTTIYIMVDTLKYLKKGGRITAAGAALATILNLKPVLQYQGEKLDAYAKVRGAKQARQAMIKAVKSDIETRLSINGQNTKLKLWVVYSGSMDNDMDDVESFYSEVKEAFPNVEIELDTLSLSIVCHVGMGALAMAACVDHRS